MPSKLGARSSEFGELTSQSVIAKSRRKNPSARRLLANTFFVGSFNIFNIIYRGIVKDFIPLNFAL